MGEHIEPQLQEMFVKGNEKIAKFLSIEKIGIADKYAIILNNIAIGYYEPSRMKFHTSWDWLKPVIDKIINMIGVKTVDECTDEEWRYYTMISRMWIGVSIVEAWVLVEDFVCFYNSGRCSLNKD